MGKVGRWVGGANCGEKALAGAGRTEAVGVWDGGSVIFWFLTCGEGP